MSGPHRLRISGGARRGLALRVPAGIRPTSGRLREALFDIWGARLAGASFLDLFAGSGAVGIEAASRGASPVVLVESDRSALSLVERNLRHADLAGISVLRARLPEELERRLPAAARFDLVFADPPYDFSDYETLLAAAEARLGEGGEIALERRWRPAVTQTADGLETVIHRRYGDSGLTVLRRV